MDGQAPTTSEGPGIGAERASDKRPILARSGLSRTATRGPSRRVVFCRLTVAFEVQRTWPGVTPVSVGRD
jgi:hypothetical protein